MKKSASGEFKTFIEEHLLRLLGIHHKKGDDTVKSNGSGKKSDLVVQEGDYVYFSTYTETPYKAKCNRSLTKDDLSVAKNIVTAFSECRNTQWIRGGP